MYGVSGESPPPQQMEVGQAPRQGLMGAQLRTFWESDEHQRQGICRYFNVRKRTSRGSVHLAVHNK